MKKKIVIGCAAAMVMVLVLAFAMIWPCLNRNALPAMAASQKEFRVEWAKRLRDCNTIQQAKALPQPPASSLIELDTRVFKDGSWILISWHSNNQTEGGCADGWNGAIMRDSEGHMFWTDHDFCCFEEFNSVFLILKADSLKQFYHHIEFTITPVS